MIKSWILAPPPLRPFFITRTNTLSINKSDNEIRGNGFDNKFGGKLLVAKLFLGTVPRQTIGVAPYAGGTRLDASKCTAACKGVQGRASSRKRVAPTERRDTKRKWLPKTTKDHLGQRRYAKTVLATPRRRNCLRYNKSANTCQGGAKKNKRTGHKSVLKISHAKRTLLFTYIYSPFQVLYWYSKRANPMRSWWRYRNSFGGTGTRSTGGDNSRTGSGRCRAHGAGSRQMLLSSTRASTMPLWASLRLAYNSPARYSAMTSLEAHATKCFQGWPLMDGYLSMAIEQCHTWMAI